MTHGSKWASFVQRSSMLGGGGALKSEDGIAAHVERRSTMHARAASLRMMNIANSGSR